MASLDENTKRFKLVSKFSLVSLLGIAVVAIVLGFFYREVAVSSLMSVRVESNADLTRAFSNSVWEKYQQFVVDSAGFNTEELLERPEVDEIDREIRRQMNGLRVVKVKVYNPQGLTIFSTERKQIGEDKSTNDGFLSAMQGDIVSEISYRDKFSAFDRVIEKRDLLSSYIPIRYGELAKIVGVFEVYTDITSLLQDIRYTEYKIIFLVTVLMGALYAFLLNYIRRADGIIRHHEKAEQSRQQEKLQYMQEHDALTGLPNRLLIQKKLDEALLRASEGDYSVSVIHLDINNFNLLNNNFGFDAANRLLQKFAERLVREVSRAHPVARVGADEFVVINENISLTRTEQIVIRLLSFMTETFVINGTELNLGISVGISLYPGDGQDSDLLLKHAETALKTAKKLGRNRYAYFTENLNTKAVERFDLETSLGKAVNNGDFHLYFQPRVEAKSGKVLSAEALIRWHRGDKMISPALFVPVLEEMGLIIKVGAWVLREACSACKGWHDQGYDHLRVSVNLSMVQFQSPGLLDDVKNALLDSGLDGRYLELELTESLLADQTNTTVDLLNEFRELGIHLSIDDFGTGYSSLSYLVHYPIDCIKIDQSFVRDVLRSQGQANLTRTIVTMAKGLQLKCVAEGVEEAAQQDLLVGLGCDELQGYLFSRPVPDKQLVEYLKKDQ